MRSCSSLEARGGELEFCADGDYVSVRVWRNGTGTAVNARLRELVGSLVDAAGVDAVLESIPIDVLVEHLKRRLSEELKAVQSRYLEERRRVLGLVGAQWLLEGANLNGHEREVAGRILKELEKLGVTAYRLVTLHRFISGIDELLDAYAGRAPSTETEPSIDYLYELLADADDIAGVDPRDTRLVDLVYAVDQRLRGEPVAQQGQATQPKTGAGGEAA